MKNIFLLLLFLVCQTTSFSQNLQENQQVETNIFYVWEELNLEDAENTGFMYQDCNFMNMLLGSVKLGIIRPYANDSLYWRLSHEDFLNRINQNNKVYRIILKNKVKYEFDKIIYQEMIAISVYSTNEKGQKRLICAFSYQELEQNLFLDNEEAVICLGNDLKISLVEVFENHSFKTTFLRKKKFE